MIFKNKDKLIAEGHNQEKGMDNDESFAPITRVEATKFSLAFAMFMSNKLH